MRGQKRWDAPQAPLHLDSEEPTAPTSYAGRQAQVEPSTSYWQPPAQAVRQPDVRRDEVATSFQRPQPVRQPDARRVDAEPATSYWRGSQQSQASYSHSSPASSPREETLLAAARGGVGRAAPVVAAPSAPQQPPAGASSRRMRPLPPPSQRAPSHLPPEDGWSDESERTVARDSQSRDVSVSRRAPAAPVVAAPAVDRDERRSRAAAGEIAQRANTAAGSGPHRLPPNPEQLSSSIAAPAAASVEPASTAASDEPVSTAAPQGPTGPLRIEAPPEVALAAYPLVRRVALQQDLKAADRVLRVGLAEQTNATTCRTWYIGVDAERFSLELTGELTAAEKALLDQSSEASQPRASGRLLVVPVIAASRVIALALFQRAENLPVFGPADLMIAMVVMQETSGFLVQLLMNHAEQQRDLAADKKSIYNPEALASQRKRGHEGGLIHLSPRWVKIAYPTAVIAVLIAIGFAIIAKVPTYSAGAGVITIEGLEITAPSPGSVSAVHVEPGQPVQAGEELARLLAQDEESAMVQADREYRNALATLLFDGADETTKSAVAAAASNRQRAADRLEAKVIRAPEDGVVGDIRVRTGAALNMGDHVLTLLRKDAEPTVLVFLPGQDRPRLRRGQTLQIELAGYTKVREKGTIVEVGAEVIGPNEARRALGQKNADAVPLNGPVVMVRASLPSRTFKVSHDTFRYHDGMPLRGEVKVENKPFLISLIPALEKAL